MFDDLPDEGSGRLVDDAYIANQLSFSRGWVRKQRFNRRHGLPHVLTIDPVLIGNEPRYRLKDFLDWLAAQKPEKSNLSGAEDSKDIGVAPEAGDNAPPFGLPMLDVVAPDRSTFKPKLKDAEALQKDAVKLLKVLDSFVKEGGSF